MQTHYFIGGINMNHLQTLGVEQIEYPVKTFSHDFFGELGILTLEGKEYFPAVEVAAQLGYSNPHNAIDRHCRERGTSFQGVLTTGGIQQKKFIDEGNLYRLIIRSKLPEAERFEKWVFDEVLPSVRKTGGYVGNDELFIQTYLPDADEQTKTLFKTTLQTLKAQNEQVATMKPKVLFAEAVESSESSVLVGELAKVIQQNGIDIGQNRLFEWLRDNGFLMRGRGDNHNLPTQRSMDLGLFEIKKGVIKKPNGTTQQTRTPKVTGKGQIYFVNKFLKDS